MYNNNNLLDVYQSQDFSNKIIGLTAYENKDDLILLLRKNGVTISDDANADDVILMTYLAIAQSPRFKSDLINYIESAYQQESTLGTNGDKAAKKADRSENRKVRIEDRKERIEDRKERIQQQGGTKVGNLLRSVGTEENIGTLLNTGLSFLSQKMTAKADKKAINAAAQLEASKAQAQLAEAKKFDAKKNQRKWIVPVAIGAIIAIVAVVYLVMKKKK